MLEGVLDRFLDEVNEHLEPIKDEIQNLDRFAFQFLMIGLFSTLFVGYIMYYMYYFYAFAALILIYLVLLGLIYYRNFRQ